VARHLDGDVRGGAEAVDGEAPPASTPESRKVRKPMIPAHSSGATCRSLNPSGSA